MPYINVRGFYNNNNNNKVRKREREEQTLLHNIYIYRGTLFFFSLSLFSLIFIIWRENNFLNKICVAPGARARVYVQTPHTRAKKTHNVTATTTSHNNESSLFTHHDHNTKEEKKWLSLSWHLWLRYVLGVNVINRLVFILFL